MKKLYSLLLIATVALSFAACSKSEFSDKYYDPSKTTTTSCDKLMTGAFMSGNGYTFNDYWRMYTWDNYFGKLAQTIGFNVDSGSMYFINDGYANDRWNNFYNILRQYRIMQHLWEGEADEDKAQDRVFVALTEVFLYDHLSQIVDIFGPVPFSKAGFLGVTGDLESSYPSYDSDVDLYKMMLTELGNLYTEIGAFNLNDLTKSKLVASDYICGGDLDKWQAYANSLMLRLGVHMSANGDLTNEGKAAVTLAASRKLVTTWEDSIVAKSDKDGFNYADAFKSGFVDINNVASQGIINAFMITGEEDPRLGLVYFPNEAGAYFGKHVEETTAEQEEHDTYEKYEDRYYAHLNAATFTYNNLFVSPIISGAEVNFLLAEAYNQNYASGNAETAFKKAIVESCKQLYDLNVHSSQWKFDAPTNNEYFYKLDEDDIPTDAELMTFAGKVWAAYGNKLEGIMTQKWAHFGITQATQAWTDIRRTGLPALNYPADGGPSATVKNIVNRVKYPNTEASNNTENYNAAKGNVGGDSRDFVLFWAKKLQ